jgi:hypothetical protein
MKYIDDAEIPPLYFKVDLDARKEMDKILIEELKSIKTFIDVPEPRRTRAIKRLLKVSITYHEEEENYEFCALFKNMLELIDQ